MNVEAQTLSDSTQGIPSPDTITNFQPSLAVVIGMLAIMFSLTFILLLYAKFCHRASSVHNTTHRIQDGLVRTTSLASGVDKTVVESLPFFRFSSLKGSKDGLECSVCLAKFEEIEILRLLPKCKHAFHIDCIDQWLEKHSTCPLCRRKVSADDLSSCSSSLRFLWNQSESNLELYVEREENNNFHHGSSRFSIGSSFRKMERAKKEEELPIQESMDCDEHNNYLHKFNHKIFVSHDVVLKNRWSNVSSSDLMFLNSELLNDVSSARFEQKSLGIRDQNDEILLMNIKQEMERKRVFEREINKQNDKNSYSKQQNHGFKSKALNSSDKRSMSEIIVHPRFIELRNKDSSSLAETDVKVERMRKLWLPIATKTAHWFANRETTHPQSQEFNL
ncbi:hypothetical protein DH2020_006280 [Rehmannia glutinosa]|uniref:RING-type domain-containing protein n=1 Tax=Rehmannia glutinosa TaxID=99300 RepID=A0ABR0XII7_REHGL